MIWRVDDARVEQIWARHFAAPMAAIQQENRRVIGGLVTSLGVGLGMPIVLVIGAIGLADENALGLEPAALWGTVGGLVLLALVAGYIGLVRMGTPAASESQSLDRAYFERFCQPAVSMLRPGWTCARGDSAQPADLFATKLVNERPLTRFEARGSITGSAHGLPFVMREITAIGSRPGSGTGSFMLTLLDGYLATLTLPAPIPGHLRFFRKPEFKERRPVADGFANVTSQMTTLEPHYEVEVTSDGVHPLTFPGLVQVLGSLAEGHWSVHLALAGRTAWIAVDRSENFFNPVLKTYTADHLKGVEYLFRTVELVASQLPGARSQAAS